MEGCNDGDAELEARLILDLCQGKMGGVSGD